MMGQKAQPEVADYTQLKYLMRCVNESMRLYPHPPVLLRRAQIQDELPGTCTTTDSIINSIITCRKVLLMLSAYASAAGLQCVPCTYHAVHARFGSDA